jgi:hypothetical protein
MSASKTVQAINGKVSDFFAAHLAYLSTVGGQSSKEERDAKAIRDAAFKRLSPYERGYAMVVASGLGRLCDKVDVAETVRPRKGAPRPRLVAANG